MSSRYETRSVSAVTTNYFQTEQIEATDEQSDNEEDMEELFSGSESEEDADDGCSNHRQKLLLERSQRKDPSENLDIAGPSTRKRRRPLTRRTRTPSRRGRRWSIIHRGWLPTVHHSAGEGSMYIVMKM